MVLCPGVSVCGRTVLRVLYSLAPALVGVVGVLGRPFIQGISLGLRLARCQRMQNGALRGPLRVGALGRTLSTVAARVLALCVPVHPNAVALFVIGN